MKRTVFLMVALALLWGLAGCNSSTPQEQTLPQPSQAETICFHDNALNTAELSPDTVQWLTWYNTLSEEEQLAVSYVPSDLYELCGYPTAEDAAAEETQPAVAHYQAYQWLLQLKAEDVAYIEFIDLDETELPYRRYEGAALQEAIDLLQGKACAGYTPIFEYAPIVQWPGYYSEEFHVVMHDGTVHTVCSVYSTVTVIDGTGFHTISDWLNNHWPETGNAPLPENWMEEAAARDYHVAQDAVSTLSTQSQDDQRFQLDHSYDTDVEFGSRSRHYPIGRGGIELSAPEASKAGVSLRAYWTGTGSNPRLRVLPQYRLEKWEEASGTYLPVDGGQFLSEASPELLPDNTRHWYLSWEDSCGYLQPGHYRIGMTFCEEYNGQAQNETTCYAKFTVGR